MATTIVWFRRDLRVHDHPALATAANGGGRVAPLFVVDDRLIAGRFRSANRLWFMRASVAELAEALDARGAPLAVIRGDPVEAVPAFAAAVGAARVLVSRDYTPYGLRRDERVATALAAAGVGWESHPGALILEPEDVASGRGQPFRVFGPFARAWSAVPRRAVVAAPGRLPGLVATTGSGAASGRLDDVLAPVTPTADPALVPAPGSAAARVRLERWASSAALERYATERDRLDLDGTSRLSQDLRWGLLSPVEVAERCAGDGEGRRRFLAELTWRDFYAHLLWHEPRIARESFRRRLDGVAWQRDRRVVDAWRMGRTGYPVVDAAMRQLHATGWMHNRARMIVASFLTKHLGVDYRVGEAHFMEHLVDGDPASNNGGWQWAASTGTDSQPWFRVFNPTRQALRHDPDGDYVRRWVPELAHVPGPDVHAPLPGAYLRPIVDHVEARARALQAYGEATRGR